MSSGQLAPARAHALALVACFPQDTELSQRLIDGVDTGASGITPFSFLAEDATPTQQEYPADRMQSLTEGGLGAA